MATASGRPFSQLPVVRRVERHCRVHQLLPSGATVLTAVSGGADSVFLLHALHALAPVLGYALQVAHFNHRWRGAESDEDARFVERLAAGLGLPFHVGSGNTRTVERRARLSPEEAARAARYRFLDRTARATGADRVAVGHTIDDQAETYLLGWLRGSGPAGLVMPPLARLPVARARASVIRPLLPLSAREVRAALEHARVEWREDSSNADPRYLRNRVRRELVPLLESLAPGFRRTIVRSARLAEAAQRYLDRGAYAAAERLFGTEGEGIEMPRGAFLALDSALRVPVLLLAVQRLGGDTYDV
ncbi:MAG TPA: tRNA lysidine(34) synthetase TilS, partial [Chloroflexota bacterium]|nr:tRNA lysidine(34) synthetase TilS [Chloroflexota bacterium]